MNTTTTAQHTERDKYGRTVQHTTIGGRTICVRVTLPKAYRQTHGHAYLVNDWAGPRDEAGRNVVTFHATIGQARAQVASISARELAARQPARPDLAGNWFDHVELGGA